MRMPNNWSLVGYLGGFLFAFFSAIRYFLLWQDTDKAIVYIIIGGIICGLAWLYDVAKEQEKSLMAIEDYLMDKQDTGDVVPVEDKDD